MIIAMLTAFFMILVAFVTDFGMAYTNKRILQNGVDAAALAAAHEIAVTAGPDDTCGMIAATMVSTTRSLAEAYFAENGADEGGAITLYDLECTTTDAVMVTVGGSETSPNFFGGVAGHAGGIALDASAKVVVGPAGSALGLRPFAVCEVDANWLKDNEPQARNIVFKKKDGDCGNASGNVGLLDLNGGANSRDEQRPWITEGYREEISVEPPVELEGKPGDTGGGALDDEVESVVEEEVLLPVFDTVTGSGAGARYHIVGFVSVEVCGFEFGSKGEFGSCFDTAADPEPGGDSYMQLRFKQFIATGDLYSSCALAAACDTGARVVKLAE